MAAADRTDFETASTNQKDAEDKLQFQSFVDDSGRPDNSEFTSFPVPTTPGSYEEESDLLSGAEKGPPSFWSFEYYQSLFDVDTTQVMHRIVWSMIPRPGYIQRCIKSRPDLYGPFWICATLVFTIAISGNIADYLRSEGREKNIWRYDFHKVSFAATAIYTYAWLVPLGIWALLWYRQSSRNFSLMQIICLYGYSLSIYVPLSILWLIDVNWLQWTLVIVGSCMSGSVLLMTFWPSVRDDKSRKVGAILLIVILLLHMLLAVGFVTYFFHAKHKVNVNHPLNPESRITNPSNPVTNMKINNESKRSKVFSGAESAKAAANRVNNSIEVSPETTPVVDRTSRNPSENKKTKVVDKTKNTDANNVVTNSGIKLPTKRTDVANSTKSKKNV